MKVSATGSTGGAATARGTRSAAGGSSFKVEREAEIAHAAPAVTTNAIAAVDALIALQSLPDAMIGRSKAVKRADEMLDLLDQIKVGILSGAIPKAVLSRLTALVQVKREGFQDPRLQEVLDEIDLRAQVELAKLEQNF